MLIEVNKKISIKLIFNSPNTYKKYPTSVVLPLLLLKPHSECFVHLPNV